MSPRAARRTLWLALLLVAPLPMLGGFGAVVPVVRYGLLAGVCVAMRVAEGPGGVVWALFALFAVHALVYAALLWGAAWLAARALARVSPAARSAVVAGIVACGLIWATATTPYVTPFGTSARAGLPEVLR
ncbi:MAG: hypothetical protein ACQGVC_12090 [Myxococcota bacterium]